MIKKLYNKYKMDLKQVFKDVKHIKTIKRQVPNMLTLSRMFGPIFIVPAAFSGNLVLAGILTGLFSMTDFFDGKLARKFNCTSELGKDLDPIVDKVFAGGLLLPFVFLNPILLVNIGLECIIAYVNTQSKIKNNNPRSTMLGKIKTTSLYSFLVASYLSLGININPAILTYLFDSTAMLQIFTSFQYKVIDMKKDKEKDEEKEIINNDVKDEIEEEKEKVNDKALTSKDYIKLRDDILNTNYVETEEKEKTLTLK